MVRLLFCSAGITIDVVRAGSSRARYLREHSLLPESIRNSVAVYFDEWRCQVELDPKGIYHREHFAQLNGRLPFFKVDDKAQSGS